MFKRRDPEDPVTRLRLPLGLDFLRLDYEFTKKLIPRYSEVKSLAREGGRF